MHIKDAIGREHKPSSQEHPSTCPPTMASNVPPHSPPTSSHDPYDLFFTGRDHPRDGCIMIGHVGAENRPVYYNFETTNIPSADTRTTVYRDGTQAVGYFDWTMGVHLGMVTIGTRQVPMSYLVMQGSTTNSRMFASASGRRYEWRKVSESQGGYDLYSGPTTRMACFRRFRTPRDTPVGPAHALLQYSFDDDRLMLEALLALSLNRWMDSQP